MTRRVTIEGSEVGFDCELGQSLLDAGLKAGIELPYSCRKGVCGNCAGGVVAGDVTGIGGGAMVNEACAPGQLLFCLCTPTSDVVLRPVTWRVVDAGARQRFTVKVHKNELAASDVSVLQLRLPAGKRAKFRAGQYLQLRLDDGSTRCYSMANPPQESDALTLHVRHLPGGRFSGQVGSLQHGALLDVELPFGSVDLDPEATTPIVFVAGGTGFAPVKSLLDDMAKRKVRRPITLIRGARQADGLYLRGAVDRWRKTWPDMGYVEALSGEAVEGAFAGRLDAALRAHCPGLTGATVYCCGSPEMVAAVREAAFMLGAAREDFHADVFVDGPAAG